MPSNKDEYESYQQERLYLGSTVKISILKESFQEYVGKPVDQREKYLSMEYKYDDQKNIPLVLDSVTFRTDFESMMKRESIINDQNIYHGPNLENIDDKLKNEVEKLNQYISNQIPVKFLYYYSMRLGIERTIQKEQYLFT